MIGLYAKTFTIRLRLDSRPTFRSFTGRARGLAVGVHANPVLPFDEVVQSLTTSRSASHHPLSRVMLALNNTPPARPSLLDLLIALPEQTTTNGRCDGIVGEFEFDADLPEPVTTRTLASRLAAVLDAAAGEPKKPMSDLTPAALTLTDLLAAAPRRDRPALLSSDRAPLSHADLAALLDELGGQLRALWLGRADRVATVLFNGPAMAVTFLAVASVSAAKPLNPAYRAGEFDFFLDDLNARDLIVADGPDGPAVEVARSRPADRSRRRRGRPLAIRRRPRRPRD